MSTFKHGWRIIRIVSGKISVNLRIYPQVEDCTETGLWNWTVAIYFYGYRFFGDGYGIVKSSHARQSARNWAAGQIIWLMQNTSQDNSLIFSKIGDVLHSGCSSGDIKLIVDGIEI